MLEKPERPGPVEAVANRDGSRSDPELDIALGRNEFTESAVASLSRFQFNPATHDLLDTHDCERVETALQTAAGDGGPLRAGGNVLVKRQPAIGLPRAWLRNPGAAGRQVLSEPAQRVRTAPPSARLDSGQRPLHRRVN
jgi:hypothetical protein